MVEVEYLSDNEIENDAQEVADAGAEEEKGEETEADDVAKKHPAAFGAEIIPIRNLESIVNHPASVRIVEKDGKRASELKEEGNALFKAKNYLEAIELYSDALEYCPETDDFKYSAAVFLSNRAACFLQLGHYEDVIEDCTDALELDSRYVKALLRRAQAHENLDDMDSALADLNKVLEIDPTLASARKEQARVDAIVKKKHEELKDEMMGKLKDLGNTVLGKFGLSLDNFKAVQDPQTGSYSISFQQ